ncbi:DUF6226 family protein [Modestobacter roseus]|uniref:DUF6226 family protein n=1 Tax=Modestobacter roseus TaxID=1181884 RepID=UPI0014125C86|nr:DUF6226 family protein [Modestobacter roseus]
MGGRWGDEEPPAEAYSRVSDPQRFLPLLGAADDLVAGLRRRFDVMVSDEPVAGRGELSAVRLSPATGAGADLVVVRTDFPGVHLRAGRWARASFPACGCDACDEQVDDAIESLVEFVGDVAGGRFGEELTAGPGPRELHTWRAGSSSTAYLTPAEASAHGEPGRFDWAPWPEHPTGAHDRPVDSA